MTVDAGPDLRKRAISISDDELLTLPAALTEHKIIAGLKEAVAGDGQ